MKSVAHVYGLCLLFSLFSFRVAAQLLQKFYPVSFLPPFEDWHSGALSYSALVGFQFILIALCLAAIREVRCPTTSPDPRKGKNFLVLGGVYFTVMIFRLIGGFTFAVSNHWFTTRIPIFFHLILASFVLVYGHFHAHTRREETQ